MKTARERAEEFLAEHPLAQELLEGDREALLPLLERSFQEHARDQRHLCAEAVTEHLEVQYDPWGEEASNSATQLVAHRTVMNTPAPGEDESVEERIRNAK